MAFSPDGKLLASATIAPAPDAADLRQPGDLKVWDADTGRQILSLNGSTCVAFSPDGKRIASAGQDNTLKWSGGFDQEGNLERIRSASGVYTLKVWDADTGAEVQSLKGHPDEVTCVAYSPDGKRIVSGSADGMLKVWDADRGVEVAALKAHTERVSSVAYSPDRKRIVSGSHDGKVKVWIQSGGEP